MENGRELNIILREYIKRISIETLEGCEDFVEVYGRGFVERKFEENVRDVYSNEKNRESAGYYLIKDKDIIICASGKEGGTLTPNDIENNESLKTTCVHETIHAILRRTIQLILKIGGEKVKKKKLGTGIQEYDDRGEEIGRGLNEGITEWICRKAGLVANAYRNLTRIVEQIEMAIGTREVMKLGKGNIAKRAAKILRISKRKCKFFLSLLDQEYTLEEKNGFFRKAIQELRGNISLEDLETIKEDFRVKNFLKTEEYRLAIAEKGKDKEAEVILEYLNEQKEDTDYAMRNNLLLIDSFIFDQYFKKEFEKMETNQEVSAEQLQIFAIIEELMQKDMGNKEEQEYSSIKFQRKFQMMRERYLAKASRRMKEEYRSGILSGNALMSYFDQVGKIDEEAIGYLVNRLADEMDIRYSTELSWLIMNLYEKGKINEINRYSMRRIKAKEQESIIYLRDNQIVGRVDLKEKESNDDNGDIGINFGLTMDEQFNDRMNSFLKLKEETEGADSQATIQISNGIIIINGREGTKIYVLDKGEVIPVERTEEIDLLFSKSNEHKKMKSLAIRTPIDMIRSFLFKGEQEVAEKSLITKKQGNPFKARISDMSNYSIESTVGKKQVQASYRKREDSSR